MLKLVIVNSFSIEMLRLTQLLIYIPVRFMFWCWRLWIEKHANLPRNSLSILKLSSVGVLWDPDEFADQSRGRRVSRLCGNLLMSHVYKSRRTCTRSSKRLNCTWRGIFHSSLVNWVWCPLRERLHFCSYEIGNKHIQRHLLTVQVTGDK